MPEHRQTVAAPPVARHQEKFQKEEMQESDTASGILSSKLVVIHRHPIGPDRNDFEKVFLILTTSPFFLKLVIRFLSQFAFIV